MDFFLKALISLAVVLISAAFLIVAIVLAKTQGLCTDAELGRASHLAVAPCKKDQSSDAPNLVAHAGEETAL